VTKSQAAAREGWSYLLCVWGWDMDRTVQFDRWLIGATVGCQTCHGEVMGLTPSCVAIKCLLLGWVTVYRQANDLKVNSAFHPCRVDKSNASVLGLFWLGLKQCVFTCYWWQVTLCDPPYFCDRFHIKICCVCVNSQCCRLPCDCRWCDFLCSCHVFCWCITRCHQIQCQCLDYYNCCCC